MAQAIAQGAEKVGEAPASSSPSATRRWRNRAIYRLVSEAAYSLAGIVFVLVLWYVFVRLSVVNRQLLPAPSEVLKTASSLIGNGQLLSDTTVSLVRVLVGFGIALAISLPLGIGMGLVTVFRRLVNPIVELARPIPPIALIPLVMLWFGIGQTAKVVIIAYGAFFPILLNTISGFHAIDGVHLRAVESLGANRWQTIRHVVIPSAVPQIIVGARLGLSMGFIVLVAAELIAAQRGLGFLIEQGQQNFDTSQVIVGVIVIGLIGLLLNRAMILLESRLLRWKPRV